MWGWCGGGRGGAGARRGGLLIREWNSLVMGFLMVGRDGWKGWDTFG